jgi:uncharacterized protein (TIGR02118 family)
MMKRISLLRRKEDISKEAFSAHWAGPHAVIAKDFQGLVKYTQNHVVQRLDPAPHDAYSTDGMAELWFPSDESMQAALASPVLAQLSEDEPRFLSGVTRLFLGDLPLDDGAGGVKIIVLGNRRPAATISADREGAMTFASVATARPSFRREALWSAGFQRSTVRVRR